MFQRQVIVLPTLMICTRTLPISAARRQSTCKSDEILSQGLPKCDVRTENLLVLYSYSSESLRVLSECVIVGLVRVGIE